MLKWSDYLYVHNSVQNEIESIKKELFKKKNANVYCIIAALSKNNVFEIMSASELSNGLYDDLDILIYGVARGKNNVKELLLNLIEAIIDDEGNINIDLLSKDKIG